MSPVVSGVGKLYNIGEKEAIASVHYQIREESSSNSWEWRGELVLEDVVNIGDSGTFMIELEDGRRGKCVLKKLVNLATSSIPTRFKYRLTGSSRLE